jgi:ElaB/YqjD/DUF883 family membrane-anchored ribosome-binding protein
MDSQFEASREKLVADFKTLVADAEELLKATAGQAGDRLSIARDRLSERLKSARVRLDETDTAMRGRANEAAQMTDEYVKTNPWTAVGVAAAIGVLLGLIIGHRD